MPSRSSQTLALISTKSLLAVRKGIFLLGPASRVATSRQATARRGVTACIISSSGLLPPPTKCFPESTSSANLTKIPIDEALSWHQPMARDNGGLRANHQRDQHL